VEEDVADLRARVDRALAQFLDRASEPLVQLAPELDEMTAALRAAVLDGGKRLRPAFCYWGYRAAGAPDDDRIVAAAAALELLQASALAHDDVIDDSDTRRGAPSAHRRFATLHDSAGWTGDAPGFGRAAAILLGDLALVWADTMLHGSGFPADDMRRALPAWDAMRTEVMCGQYLDVVEQARGGGSVERALRVARFKSAKYTVERPLHLGALLGGGDRALLDALTCSGSTATRSERESRRVTTCARASAPCWWPTPPRPRTRISPDSSTGISATGGSTPTGSRRCARSSPRPGPWIAWRP
jgi:geranylgeranyl diphosphate synthase type I